MYETIRGLSVPRLAARDTSARGENERRIVCHLQLQGLACGIARAARRVNALARYGRGEYGEYGELQT